MRKQLSYAIPLGKGSMLTLISSTAEPRLDPVSIIPAPSPLYHVPDTLKLGECSSPTSSRQADDP